MGCVHCASHTVHSVPHTAVHRQCWLTPADLADDVADPETPRLKPVAAENAAEEQGPGTVTPADQPSQLRPVTLTFEMGKGRVLEIITAVAPTYKEHPYQHELPLVMSLQDLKVSVAQSQPADVA